MKQVMASIMANDEVMPGVYLICLESSQITSVAKPGQFVMVRCGEENLLRRPLSIHQLGNNEFALLYSVVGKGTRWLSKRQTGERIDILGPLGNSFSIHPTANKLLLVAGGMGVAPLCFLAQEAGKRGCSVTLLLGASTSTQLCPSHLLPADISRITTTEDGTAGKRGMITDLLPDFIDWADQVFACGPVSMYRDIANKYHPFLKDKSAQVSLEMRMGCGRGVCYGCTVKTKNGLRMVCTDGPIFNLEDILWDKLNCY